MNRRKFLKLLGTIPLALGLRLPWNLKRESKPIDSPFGWWFEDSNGEKWKSVDEGETWHKIVCQNLDDWERESKIVYVSPCGDDINDGLTTENAKRSIASALAIATNSDAIWVFPGSYQEKGILQPRGRFYMAHAILRLEPNAILDLTQCDFVLIGNVISRGETQWSWSVNHADT